MSNRQNLEHLSAETMQALLDGDLPTGERRRAEGHLDSCARCAAQMDGWRTLFEGLQELPTLAPAANFADRVLEGVARPERLSWAARVRARMGGTARPAHPGDGELQDWVEGVLPNRAAARVAAHVEGCRACGAQAEGWRTVLGSLATLDRFAPSEGFAARVMAEVRIPVAARAVQRVPEWRRALAWARSVVPHTRKAWATISGVALTPLVTLGLVVWTVFTHPTVTPGALVSFAWWKASDVAALAWNGLASRVMQSSEIFGLFSFIRSLAVSPTTLVAAFVAFSAATVVASWVLYRNLYTRPVEGGYAHVSSR